MVASTSSIHRSCTVVAGHSYYCDRFHWKINTPELEITQTEKLKFLGTDSNQINIFLIWYRGIPRNLSFSIWWILEMQRFQWKLSWQPTSVITSGLLRCCRWTQWVGCQSEARVSGNEFKKKPQQKKHKKTRLRDCAITVDGNMYMCMYIYMYTYMYTHTCIHIVYIYVRSSYVELYLLYLKKPKQLQYRTSVRQFHPGLIYINIYIHIYIYIYIHMYMHIYINI